MIISICSGMHDRERGRRQFETTQYIQYSSALQQQWDTCRTSLLLQFERSMQYRSSHQHHSIIIHYSYFDIYPSICCLIIVMFDRLLFLFAFIGYVRSSISDHIEWMRSKSNIVSWTNLQTNLIKPNVSLLTYSLEYGNFIVFGNKEEVEQKEWDDQ